MTNFRAAQTILTEHVEQIETERLPLSLCGGRILAENIIARENVPPFDHSAYDGYAFRADDSVSASPESKVLLRILEEIPAGAVPTRPVSAGTAVKILTGAPIPAGADAVCKYEDTEFNEKTVKLRQKYRPGSNIVFAGKNIRAGQILAHSGDRIDSRTAGMLASQGILHPLVFRRPRVGILSTGSEVQEPDQPLIQGKIRNSNRYVFETVLKKFGFETEYLGLAGDITSDIAALIRMGLKTCDAVISTGGVSAGDYDLTPEAMEMADVELLFRGVSIKPGMACAYGVSKGKPVCGLSGNTASAIINFYAVALPVLRKLAGCREPGYREFPVSLCEEFRGKSTMTRLLQGKLDLSDGTARMHLSDRQGNPTLNDGIGREMIAVVPAGSGPVEPGTILKGFMLI